MPNFYSVLSFFFQAEDGIRDFHVTGVQTCALPIYMRVWCVTSQAWLAYVLSLLGEFAEGRRHGEEAVRLSMTDEQWQGNARIVTRARSEERRVGKECRTRRWRSHTK